MELPAVGHPVGMVKTNRFSFSAKIQAGVHGAEKIGPLLWHAKQRFIPSSNSKPEQMATLIILKDSFGE